MFEILLAEDNPGDVLLFREALNSRQLPCNLVVAADGPKAIALLGGNRSIADGSVCEKPRGLEPSGGDSAAEQHTTHASAGAPSHGLHWRPI